MAKTTLLPRQCDALRHDATRDPPLPIDDNFPSADNIDLLLQLEEEKRLLLLIAPSFLSRKQLVVAKWLFNLDDQGHLTRRDIARKINLTLPKVLELAQEAEASIKKNFDAALAEYERKNSIKRRRAKPRLIA